MCALLFLLCCVPIITISAPIEIVVSYRIISNLDVIHGNRVDRRKILGGPKIFYDQHN